MREDGLWSRVTKNVNKLWGPVGATNISLGAVLMFSSWLTSTASNSVTVLLGCPQKVVSMHDDFVKLVNCCR